MKRVIISFLCILLVLTCSDIITDPFNYEPPEVKIPDLTISTITIPQSEVYPTSNITITAQIDNIGNGNASSATLVFYRQSDDDTNIGITDTEEIRTNMSMESGESMAMTMSFSAKSATNTYYYGACLIDVDGENNRDNNCSAAVMVRVIPVPKPDLIVINPSASRNAVETGEEFTLSATLKNIGNANIDNSTVKVVYYQSDDANLSQVADTLIASNTITISLNTDTTTGDSEPITAPTNNGTYYYGACVVIMDNELNTNNNCTTNTVMVTVSRGTAIITNITTTITTNETRFYQLSNVILATTTYATIHNVDGNAFNYRYIPLSSANNSTSTTNYYLSNFITSSANTNISVTTNAVDSSSYTSNHYQTNNSKIVTYITNATNSVSNITTNATTNTNLGNKNLSGIDFSSLNVSGYQFVNANLSNANFTNAIVSNANFYNANLSYATFNNANLSSANFRFANLTDANLRDANLQDADLSNADLRDANLTNANLSSANLQDADLRDANFTNANLTNVRLSGEDYLYLRSIGFDGFSPNLIGANLIGANLIGANLIGANLIGANLRNTDIRYANLSNANLPNASLHNANLNNTSLHSANLTNANLSNASLQNANLTNANLSNANLWNANLWNANLSNANLTNAKVNLENYIYLTENLNYKNSGYISSDFQKALASDGSNNHYFGRSVSISGDYAIVGAPQDNDNGGFSGSAYIFSRSGNNWTQQAKLIPSDGSNGDYFGYSVSIFGNHALIGAYGDDDNGSGSGSAYVFTRSGTNWTQKRKVTAYDGSPNDGFGWSVSILISSDSAKVYALIGADSDDDNGTDSGSAYILRWDNYYNLSFFSYTTSKLKPNDGSNGDSFGRSVFLSENYALVGSWWDDDNGADSGSAYIFNRSGNNWTQQAKIKPNDGSNGNWFGSSVSMSGDYAIVGAGGNDNFSGSAYIFSRSGSNWTQQAKIKPNDGSNGDWFGLSVSISGDYAIAGAINNGLSGSAYIFSRSGNNWTQQAKITPSDGTSGDVFGNSISISGDYAIVGNYDNDDNGAQAGAAYMVKYK